MIPQGWQEKTINDVCIVERGSSPRPIKNFITSDDSGVNWIKIGDCSGKYVTNTAQKITIEGAKKSRAVKVGDFIISNSMSYGKPYILKIDGFIHDGWFVLKLDKNLVNTDYFYHLLSSNYVREQYDALATGAIVQNISSDLIKKVKFLLPPLPEQERIVAKLDKAFEAIDKVKANAEQNLTNAKELFESTLNNWMNKFEKQPTISLINAYNFIDYRGVTPNKISSGVPLVTAKNVKMGYIDYTIKDFISEKDYNMRQSRGISRKGDILFTTEAPLGNVALADLDKFSAGQRIITFQQYDNSKYQLNNVFYCYFMQSKTFQNTIHSLATGATAQGIKASRLKFVNIPLVPSSEQQKIVEKLDALQEQTKQFEQIYTKKIKDLDELKQSILQKAFRGEL